MDWANLQDGLKVDDPFILKQKARYVADLDNGEIACKILLEEAGQVISVRGEGILGPCGRLSLLSISLCNHTCFVFDILCCPQLMIEGGLKELLECSRLLKVTHNCKGLSGLLYNRFGITMKPVFDLQCAHAVVEFQNLGCSPFDVPPTKLSEICSIYASDACTKELSLYLFHACACLDAIQWFHRPLHERLMFVAAAEVMIVFPETYRNVRYLVMPCNLQKVFDMSALYVFFHIDPDLYEKETKIVLTKRYLRLKKKKCCCTSTYDDGGGDDDN